jgi:hypothetical protein
VLVGTEQQGVLRSEDDGHNWSGANAGLLDLTVLSVALSPTFGADGLGFVGTSSGVYRTRNAARSWREVDTGVPEPAVQSLAIGPDHLVLAGTEEVGLLRSPDAGTTWQVCPALASRSVIALAVSPSGAIAAATEAGVTISHDGGVSWRTPAGPTSVVSLTYLNEALLMAGVEHGGVWMSSDDGASWSPANVGLHARVLSALVVSPDFTRTRTVVVAGPGEGARVWAVSDDTLEQRSVALAETPVYGLAVSQSQALFAATRTGVFVSHDEGIHWECCFDQDGPVRAVCGGQRILATLEGGVLVASDDDGRAWRSIASPLPGAEIIALACGADGTLFAAAVDSEHTVVYRSTDGGTQWQRWLVERGKRESLALAVSPNYRVDELVYVGLDHQILRPHSRSAEVHAGERRPLWQRVDMGERDQMAVTALAVSPAFGEDRAVFAATSCGVFVSRDQGARYQPWDDGPHPRRVIALACSPNFGEDRQVFALEVGGSLWCRRDR